LQGTIKMKKNIRLVVILLALLVAAGCTPSFITPANPTPPPDLAITASVLQTQVANTVVAAVTRTAEAITTTPAPTETPFLETSTPTPTVFITPTAPPTSIPTTFVTLYPSFTNTPGPWQCAITNQVLKWGAKVPRNVDMDARWTVKNVGTEDWESGGLKYEYVTGQKFFQHDSSYSINESVNKGESTDLVVDLLTPKVPGYYHMEWALRYGDTTLCILPVDIYVTE
jgi:hypothetical protein